MDLTTEVVATEKPHQFLVRAPWVQATFETNAEDREQIEAAIKALKTQENVLTHAPAISEIFAQLIQFPVVYTLARSQLCPRIYTHLYRINFKAHREQSGASK